MSDTPDILLGLIGDNISRSRSPLLHRLAGQQNGKCVRYDRLIPRDMGEEFDTVFDACAGRGYRGINVTYPYKERAAKKVTVDDPLVRAIGAVNTVLFGAGGAKGFNTDHSGFAAAYRGVRAEEAPGTVCLIGTGGVGRAVAFALASLGAEEIRLVDRDADKARIMATELETASPGLRVPVVATAEQAAQGADGVINCTPVGMVGYDGTPIEAAALDGASWCFDAVYTPVDTLFLTDAARAGLTIISGYELFFYQGVHAWAHFAGLPLDEPALRRALLDADDTV